MRADSVRQLSEAGWRDLVSYGVRTIVDLRLHDELEEDAPHDAAVAVVHVPLVRADEAGALEAVWRSAGDDVAGIRNAYMLMLERFAPRFARAVSAVGQASEGGVLVHCFAGKDRTGLVCALLLRLAGVGVEDIAADYALSAENIRPLIDPWATEAPDEEERRFRLRVGSSPPRAMAEVLARLERDHGGVAAYLRAGGASEEELELARARLAG